MISLSRHAGLASSVFSLVIGCAAITGCHQNDKTIEPQFADGAIYVSVADVDGHDRGGVGRVTYVTRGKGTLRSETAAFTGVQPVPVHVVVGKDELDLAAVELAADATSKPFLSVSGEELSAWTVVARKGVSLSVVVDAATGAPTATSHSFSMRATPPVIALPETVSSRPVPQDALESQDVSSALNALRYSAAATDDYHKDLAAMLAKAGTVDAAHLTLLLDAVYFTGQSLKELGEFLDHRGENDPLAARSRESAEALQSRARATYALAVQLAPYSNALLDAGVAKVSDLSYEKGATLLTHLIPVFNTEVGTAAFQALAAQVKLTGEQKLALARLAHDKGNFTVVQSLLLDWFQSDAAFSVTALAQQLGVLVPSGSFRDALLLKAAGECSKLSGADVFAIGSLMAAGDAYSSLLTNAAPLVASLSTAELVQLMGQNNSWAGAAVALFLSKLSDSSALNLAAIGSHLSGEARQAFALAALGGFAKLSCDEFAALAALLEGDLRDTTVLAWLPRIADRDAAHLAQLFGLLSPGARATHLLSFIDALPSLTADALITLSQAAPERTSFILLAYIDRLTDFTPLNAVKMARYLGERDKDSVLLLVMERAKTVTADELYAVGAAAYEKASYLLKNNLAKVSPLDAQGVASLARLINDYSKDEFILAAIDRLGAVTTADLIALSGTTYSRGQYILVHYLDRVSDLTVENTVTLAGRVAAQDQAQVVKFWFSKNTKLTTQELIQLAQASYYSSSATMIAQMEKVSDLTVANAIVITQRLNYNDRDTFLLKAVSLVTDLSSANLLALAGNAYASRDAVIQKGVDRLANH